MKIKTDDTAVVSTTEFGIVMRIIEFNEEGLVGEKIGTEKNGVIFYICN